ncbi:MAG: hypothetical protein WA733_20195, partial [Methylocystis sp.]
PGLSGFEIDGAVNVDALSPARLFDRELFSARRPAANRPRRMGRMQGVGLLSILPDTRSFRT